MIEIGKRNSLIVIRATDFGVYLDGENLGDILLPSRYVPSHLNVGDSIDVFIYRDSEDRLIATTEQPLAMVNTVAYLRVVSSNRFGTFLDWGLPKDLLVPLREQEVKMKNGHYYPVFVYLDHASQRIVASSRLKHFLNNRPPQFNVGDEVDIIIIDTTQIGYKAAINDIFIGMVYKNEVYGKIELGQRMKAYIKQVRADGKIDLTLNAPTVERTDDLAQRILSILLKERSLPFSDHSSPEEIDKAFSCSKKDFKRAIGALYRNRKILIGDNSISIVDD